MNTLDYLWSTAGDGPAFHQGYGDYLAQLMRGLDYVQINRAAQRLEAACRAGRTVFCVGNGGSAAMAAHFATDLAWTHRTGPSQPPRVISLTTHTAMMTAVANDAGYQDVFLEQLRGLFQPGDVVVAISSSGNSENVLRAVRYAHEHGGFSVGLSGFTGGQLRSLCTLAIHVETPPGDYEPVEDAHQAVCHMLASAVKRRLARPVRAVEFSGVAP